VVVAGEGTVTSKVKNCALSAKVCDGLTCGPVQCRTWCALIVSMVQFQPGTAVPTWRLSIEVLAAPQAGLVQSAGMVIFTSVVVLSAPLKITPSCSKGRNIFSVGCVPAG
jgi:hypothetical protein